MLVFFKRVPKDTQSKDIKDWVAAAVKGGWFSTSGTVTSITIIERPNPLHSVTDYHGIATIEPDSVAERVIKKLNGKLFRGKYIEVRRYYIRKVVSNPNKEDPFFDDEDLTEKDKTDRRQAVKKEENLSINVSAVKSFQRKG